MSDSAYLCETPMLDYSSPLIVKLVESRGWKSEEKREMVKSIYDYVRDEIFFGYNSSDSIPASRVISDGYGQCNTKATLFMALLRSCNVECRIHGFTIDKKLQKGAATGLVYLLAPDGIFHSWVEVKLGGVWYSLEGLILDKAYLEGLRRKFPTARGPFTGYGVAVRDFNDLHLDFSLSDTYIQSEGITADWGIYDSPDELLLKHHQKMSQLKAFFYSHIGRHLMNRNVRRIRGR